MNVGLRSSLRVGFNSSPDFKDSLPTCDFYFGIELKLFLLL